MDWYQPLGATASPPWTVRTGLSHAGLSVLALPPGGSTTIDTGEQEMLVVPLAGGAHVECGGRRYELAGRADVFAGRTDFAYLPRRSDATIGSASGGRFAVAAGPCGRDLPFRYGPAGQVPVELRGAGRCSRQVNNLAAAGGFECDRLIVVEVLTPDGNWSSYPPHKHDEHSEHESELATTGCTARRGGRSTCSPRCAPVTWCWCRTAGTDRRWPRRATRCTT
jgi:5-deoxy-glucuronate isomerase